MLWEGALLCYLLLVAGFETVFSASVIQVEHGLFTNVIINGLVNLEVHNIPVGSKFIVYHFHSPFNPILISTSDVFPYDLSVFCSHCGLVSNLDNRTVSTLYVYSSYAGSVNGWIKAIAYGETYPFPGGCGPVFSRGKASATIETSIMSAAIVGPEKEKLSGILDYWTSAIQFTAASLPIQSGGFMCPYENMSSSDRENLIYHVYSIPMITAGGSYGALTDPTPQKVASLIERMTDWHSNNFSGNHIHSFKINEGTLRGDYLYTLLSARRPGTAYIITIVVEHVTADYSSRVSYAPFVLYGCPIQVSTDSRSLFYGLPINNASLQTGCGILPKDVPLIYFPVAVLLLASLGFAVACNVWIWPRCAVSVMIFASTIGLIFFYRYSHKVIETYFILIVSALFPAILALITFVILWWRCIRPTLYYRRIFGRGPLVNAVDTYSNTHLNEPWNSDILNMSYQPHDNSFADHLQADYNAVSTLAPVTEEAYGTFHSTGNTGSLSQQLVSEPALNSNQSEDDYVYLCGVRLYRRPKVFRSSNQNTGKSVKLFSLRPRRIARLPPALPCTFLLVGFLSVSLDRFLSLNSSAASFISFSILMSILILGLSTIFKNLAFGISTATVGMYLSLSCACLFLVPNALLPQIIVEYFLMLTWYEIRLPVLRIDFYGQNDVIVLVLWFISSLIFGLLALCLIRLQDARELSEAQHYEAMNVEPYNDQTTVRPITTNTTNLSLWKDLRSSSQLSSFASRFLHSPSLIPNVNSYSNISNSGTSYFQGNLEATDNQPSNSLDNILTSSNARLPTERQPLLHHGPFVSTYGGLTTNSSRQPLMPLSKVQLAAAAAAVNVSTLSPNLNTNCLINNQSSTSIVSLNYRNRYESEIEDTCQPSVMRSSEQI